MDRFRRNCSDFFSPAVIAVVIILFLIMDDTGNTAALRHLAVVFSVSFFMRPFNPIRNLVFPDAGFAMDFGLGAFICFFPAWTLSALGLCRYADPVIFITFLVMALSGCLIKKYILKEAYVTHAEFKRFLGGFAVFAVIFLAFFWMIGFNPLVDAGTENYMDYGFIRTIMRQEAAIPNDIWFATDTLNYYYLGQALCVLLLRLGQNTTEFGYNMLLATFAGMVFLMVFELTAGVAGALFTDKEHTGRCAVAGGIVGGLLAAFGANPHWFFYGIMSPLIQKITGRVPDKDYWFPDGTVFIRSELGDPDNGKNEFPAYSVILGDLHAHVINLMLVLPLLALLFDHCIQSADNTKRWWSNARIIYALLLVSMLLGYYKGSNYWDFAIYYVITGAVIVFCDIKRFVHISAAITEIVSKALFITAISIISPLPFTMHFIKMESGIELCETHTPLFKFAVLWMLPVIAAAGLITVLYFGKRGRREFDKVCRAGLLSFVLCTIGLIIVPELIYVRDIYGADNRRFNTMFKLTYQAYVLFAFIAGLLFSILVYELVSAKGRSVFYYILTVAAALYTVMSASYTVYAAHQWLGDITDPGKRTGISSVEGLRDDPVYGFEMKACDILDDDDSNVVNIVEAAGDSYSHQDALSVYSGACTPVGWFVHEWMWHNDAGPVRERADYVSYFYTSGNEQFCRNFIKLYDIDYIFVGPAEVCKYPVNAEGFKNLGKVCVSEQWQGCDLMLIRVDRSKL